MSAAFFSALYGSSRGWVSVVRYPPSERTSGKAWADMDLNEAHWFRWPNQQSELVEFCEAHSDEDLSVPVAVCTARNFRKESIPELNVIHCDADGAAPSRFAVEPSMIIQSSPGRYQLYWILKDPAPRDKVEPVAKAVAYSQREWGADLGWAANKLLRVPGTTNTKPQYKNKKGEFPQVTARITGKVYTLKELKKAFRPDPNAPAFQNVHTKPFPGQLPRLADVLSKITPTNDFIELYQEPAAPTTWNPSGSRYKVLYKLACQLFRAGHSAPEVFVICANSASNKYEQDGRNELELWRDVLKAEADVESNSLEFFEEIVDGESRQYLIDTTATTLLTDEERVIAENTSTFIDEYCEWAVTRARLADKNYHIANAMTVLSTVLSEYGYALPRHGSMGLELWFMVLGVTTRSYKTTAAKLMLHCIERIQTYIQPPREFPFRMAADPTPQSMTDSLARRGEISSIFHVDEAHGLISAEKGGTGYMAGMIRLLTQLYDGYVPAVDRITRNSTAATRTHLTMNLLGVPGKMAQTLHRDDFASGFLARFIFVLGTPAPDDRESLYLKQGNPLDKRDHDGVSDEMCLNLGLIAQTWAQRAAQYEDGRVPIMVADDAWKRWNDLNFQLNELGKKSDDPEATIPTGIRTAISVHKLACLFAMYDQEVVVRMKHMLKAISYAEQWYATMLQMVSLVHQNEWARQVHELIDFVREHVRVSYNTAYRRFSNYKPREFEDMVNSALTTGRLRRTLDGKTQFLEIGGPGA